MWKYLQAVWACRMFWLSLAKLDVVKRYRRSLVGLGWTVLQPVLMALIVSGVFSTALDFQFQDQFVTVLLGLCFWNFITGVVQNGCICLHWSETYIRQHRAPIAAYPIRIVLAAGFHFLAAALPVILLSWLVRGTFDLTIFLFLFFALAVLFAFGWAVATLCAFLTVYVPDTRQASELGLQMMFYCTPILYPPQALRDRGLNWVVDCNPLAALLELVRQPILAGALPSTTSLITALVSTAVALCLAGLLLASLERRVIFRL